jgi:hypothetical protein
MDRLHFHGKQYPAPPFARMQILRSATNLRIAWRRLSRTLRTIEITGWCGYRSKSFTHVAWRPTSLSSKGRFNQNRTELKIRSVVFNRAQDSIRPGQPTRHTIPVTRDAPRWARIWPDASQDKTARPLECDLNGRDAAEPALVAVLNSNHSGRRPADRRWEQKCRARAFHHLKCMESGGCQRRIRAMHVRGARVDTWRREGR